MTTLVVGPPTLKEQHILAQGVSSTYEETGVVVLIDREREGLSLFTQAMIDFCVQNNLSFLVFKVHWELLFDGARAGARAGDGAGDGAGAETAAIANCCVAASQLVAFLTTGDTAVVKMIGRFKQDHKPVRIVRQI